MIRFNRSFAHATWLLVTCSLATACIRSKASEDKSNPPPISTANGGESVPRASGSAAALPLANAGPYIRDRGELTVDGKKEVWTLEWRTSPSTVCIDEASLATCACDGVAYGETGSLVLRRHQGDSVTEELPLDPLFGGGKSRLVRWAPTAEELSSKKVGIGTEIVTRAVTPILVFKDYDHDGQATEFLLQITSEPCGHRGTVVVGVDRRDPKLHVFSSVENKAQALVLNGAKEWDEVRSNKTASLVELACGDHGSKEELRFDVSADDKGIHVAEKKRACN